MEPVEMKVQTGLEKIQFCLSNTKSPKDRILTRSSSVLSQVQLEIVF